jgi:hypothetical protein
MKTLQLVHKSYFVKVFFATSIILSSVGMVTADAVTDWNARTVTYAAGGGRPGPSWVLDVAVVQAAVYDAVQAIEGDYQPYCGSIPGATGSTAGAAATAARDVLVNRFPAQAAAITLDYNNYLAANGIPPGDPGIAVGHAAALCMINLRAGDGAFPAAFPPFVGGSNPGDWRPTPPANAPMAAAWMGGVTPFTMRSSSQFRAKRAPKLGSPEYTRAYNEVKDLGSATGSGRTVDQTELAHFWNGNFPGQMNRLARDLAIEHGIGISETSRLLALVDFSMGDALIACWNDKVHYNFWRPITAIRLGDDDGNSNTHGDPLWTPLVVTPPYPDYTSGANNIAASATRALSLFFHSDNMEFQIETTNPIPTMFDVRSYNKFSEVRDEVVEARILQGIHFRFADDEGRKQGEHIAQWANAHYFRPAGELVAVRHFDAGEFVGGF